MPRPYTPNAGSATLKLTVLGCALEAQLRSSGIKHWLMQRWHAVHETMQGRDFRIILDEQAHVPEAHAAQLAHGSAQMLEVAGQPLACYSVDEHSVLFGDAEAGVYLQYSDKQAHLTLWGMLQETPEEVDPLHEYAEVHSNQRYLPLFVAMVEAFRHSGLLSLHAAAAVAPHSQGAALFLGPSGRGKTTTLLRAVAAGWHAIAEDFLWLEPDSMQLYSLEKYLKVWPEILTELPETLREQATGRYHSLSKARSKAIVRYADLNTYYPQQSCNHSRLTSLVLLERDPEQASAWLPLSRRDATIALWQAIGMPLQPARRQQLARAIPKILSHTRLQCLRLGQHDVPDILARGLPESSIESSVESSSSNAPKA